MALSADLLNAEQADLRGPMERNFVRSVAVWDQIQKGNRLTVKNVTYVERLMSGSTPARGVGLYQGTEPLDMVRRNVSQKIQVEPHRLAVAINIPQKDLDRNDGREGAIRLIEDYPAAVMDGIAADMESYLLTGVSRGLVFATSELAGLLTLNGLFSTGRNVGTTNGLLDFAAPGSQTDTVQNLAKSSGTYHYNQYGDISLWANDGMPVLRQVSRAVAHWGAAGRNSGADLVIMDDDTFGKYTESRSGNIRVSMLEDKQEKTVGLDLDLHGAKVLSSLDLDRTQFTGAAADGVTYVLTTRHFELVFIRPPTLSKFEDRIAQQDGVTAKFVVDFALVCKKPIAQGCVSGGAF